MNIVILAAGVGRRMKSSVPKPCLTAFLSEEEFLLFLHHTIMYCTKQNMKHAAISCRRDEGKFHFDRFFTIEMERRTLESNTQIFTECLSRPSEPHQILGGTLKYFFQQWRTKIPNINLYVIPGTLAEHKIKYSPVARFCPI